MYPGYFLCGVALAAVSMQVHVPCISAINTYRYLYATYTNRVAQISMGGSSSVIRGANGREYLLEEEQRGEEEVGL